MSGRKRGLGRGLDALLGIEAPTAEGVAREAPTEELRQVPVESLQRGKYQPRRDMKTETLQELADSIRARGVVQPIVVRPLAEHGRYEIVAGERRWRASQIAGLHDVPVIIRRIDDEAAMGVALIENIQREDLNPLEEARALERLVNEFELTHQQVADAIGRSRASVSNLLRLLDLAEPVRQHLEDGDIEMGHARALLALDAVAQAGAAERVINGGLSVRDTERLVRSLLEQDKKTDPARTPPRKDPDVARLESDLAGRLGAPVSIRHAGSGKGSVTIRYNSLDELDGILNHIK